MYDVDGVNAGYARLLLDEYLEHPEAVPAEWRALFESGDAAALRSLPGLARLLEQLPRNGGPHVAVEPPAQSRQPTMAMRRSRRRLPPPASRPRSTSSCSAPSRPRWRSSRPIGCTATWRRGSIRSARRRSATPRSTLSGSSRG